MLPDDDDGAGASAAPPLAGQIGSTDSDITTPVSAKPLRFSDWPRGEKIAVVGLILTAFGLVIAFIVGGINYLSYSVSKDQLDVARKATAPMIPEPKFDWLYPANEPDPPTTCARIDKESYLVAYGDSAIYNSGSSKFTIIQLNSCSLLSLQVGPNGALFDADINDKLGHHLGSIRNNKWSIVEDKGLHLTPLGFSGFAVHYNDEELLYVQYLNPHAFKVRGIFTCADPRIMTEDITEKDTIIENTLSHYSANCQYGGTGTFNLH